MITWIYDHTWIIPLAITIVCLVVFFLGAISAKTGDDAIGLGIVATLGIIISVVSWGAWLIFWALVAIFRHIA